MEFSQKFRRYSKYSSPQTRRNGLYCSTCYSKVNENLIIRRDDSRKNEESSTLVRATI